MQALSLKRKVEKLLNDNGVTTTREVPLKVLVPLLEGATIEGDDKLHNLYAALLANALDPNYSHNITRNFVSILSELEPIDVAVLEYVVSHEPKGTYIRVDADNPFKLAECFKDLGMPEYELRIAVRNLFRLGLLRPVFAGSTVEKAVMEFRLLEIVYKDIDEFVMTELGDRFVRSIRSNQGR